ncbi:hypothetical protein OROMI_005166 [Orobanche minor]
MVSMFDQIQPWLSVFDDDNMTRKIIQMLVHLDTCLLRLLKRRTSMDKKLIDKFFYVMLREYSKLADKKDMWEFASRICIIIFQQYNLSLSIEEILIPVCKYFC